MNSLAIAAELDPIQRLTRDLKTASQTLSPAEARYLVDAYYTIQDYRIESANRVRALNESEEPCSVIGWLLNQTETLERQLKRALDAWTSGHPVGLWLKSVTGIGPVLAAGFLAHIDITKAPTVGHIWSFAGLEPKAVWGKGEKRPWNARLKVICWKAGESFVKVSSNEKDVYGKVYRQRKDLEIARNDTGEYADQAAAVLAAKRIGKDTEAYKHYAAGKLPPAHIHARAKRYAVKLFLSHLHDVWYRQHYKTAPPLPYPIAHLGHVHYIAPPGI